MAWDSRPQNAPGWLARGWLAILRPFALTEELLTRRPWDAIRAAMRGGLADFSWTEMFFGFAFIGAGTRKPDR